MSIKVPLTARQQYEEYFRTGADFKELAAIEGVRQG